MSLKTYSHQPLKPLSLDGTQFVTTRDHRDALHRQTQHGTHDLSRHDGPSSADENSPPLQLDQDKHNQFGPRVSSKNATRANKIARRASKGNQSKSNQAARSEPPTRRLPVGELHMISAAEAEAFHTHHFAVQQRGEADPISPGAEEPPRKRSRNGDFAKQRTTDRHSAVAKTTKQSSRAKTASQRFSQVNTKTSRRGASSQLVYKLQSGSDGFTTAELFVPLSSRPASKRVGRPRSFPLPSIVKLELIRGSLPEVSFIPKMEALELRTQILTAGLSNNLQTDVPVATAAGAAVAAAIRLPSPTIPGPTFPIPSNQEQVIAP